MRRTYYSIKSTTPYNTPIPRLDDGLEQKQEYQPEPTISDREKPEGNFTEDLSISTQKAAYGEKMGR